MEFLKYNFCKKPTFSMTKSQTEKSGKVHLRNNLEGSYMKFYLIWSRSRREMVSSGRTDGRVEGRTDEEYKLEALEGLNRSTGQQI